MSVLSLSKRNLMPSLANSFFTPSIWDMENDFPAWDLSVRTPTANIIENTKDYRIEMAAPGLEKKDFHISVENDLLTISAEKEEKTEEKNDAYTSKEFSYNSFSRSFRLPENWVADKVDAKYENGILKITLPKKEVTVLKPAKEIKVS